MLYEGRYLLYLLGLQGKKAPRPDNKTVAGSDGMKKSGGG